MSIQELLSKLSKQAEVVVEKVFEADVKSICSEGKSDWMKEITRLSRLPEAEMPQLKEGKPLKVDSLFKAIHDAMSEKAEWTHQKQQDALLYATLSGMDFASVLAHKADKSRPPRRDSSITQPAIQCEQANRNQLFIELEQAESALVRYDKLFNESQDEALGALLDELETIIQDKKEKYTASQALIEDMFQQLHELERQYAYTIVEGKLVFDKAGEMNSWHNEIVRKARVALTALKPYEQSLGFDKVLVAKARKTFKVA